MNTMSEGEQVACFRVDVLVAAPPSSVFLHSMQMAMMAGTTCFAVAVVDTAMHLHTNHYVDMRLLTCGQPGCEPSLGKLLPCSASSMNLGIICSGTVVYVGPFTMLPRVMMMYGHLVRRKVSFAHHLCASLGHGVGVGRLKAAGLI